MIANLSYLPGRPDKIRNGTRRPVPNINWEPFPPQVPSHAPTDNPKPDYTDVFARCMRHRLPRSINAATRNQTAGKSAVRQCRNWPSPGPRDSFQRFKVLISVRI